VRGANGRSDFGNFMGENNRKMWGANGKSYFVLGKRSRMVSLNINI
jgi:hypothetical protein